MQDILTCVMGLDVHRDIIVACLAKGELGTDPEIEIRSFSTLIPEMQKLRDWVLEADCHHVAMESTGIYWQPIMDDVMVLTLLYIGVFCPVKENIEIQATCFERIRPYRMNEASENGEVSAAIESMGKHGSINSYFYVKLSAQLLAQLPAFNTMKFLLSDGGSWNLIFYTGTDKYTYPFPAEEMEKLCTAHGIIIHH